jgi:pimeloyl-ACP methyl ester carboxylesterase
MVDIGGRRLHLICTSPDTAPDTAQAQAKAQAGKPLILLEAGLMGFSAGWDAVQKQLSLVGLRSCAYDRAGLGYSDPGPAPRDGAAIVGDLEALLKAADLPGPYILVGHSMAGLHIRYFALRHPDQVKGLVLVDATSPELAKSKWGRAFLKSYKPTASAIETLSFLRLMPLATPWFGDPIGLDPAAHREVEYFFADRQHEHWGAMETDQSFEAARETAKAGELDPNLPVVAILRAHDSGAKTPWGKARYDAAIASKHGAVVSVSESSHPALIGRDHAIVVVKAVLSVIDLAQPSPVVAAGAPPAAQAEPTPTLPEKP